MRNRSLIFAFCLLFVFNFSLKARADIEGIQAVITALGDVVEGFKEQAEKAQSLYESGQQLASQVKQYADEAKATVEKGRQMYADAKEKAEAIKAKANGAIEAIKNKDINALQSGISNMEFSALKDTYDGSHTDGEMAEAILDTLVRQRGNESIANQKLLSESINKRNGLGVANVYAKSMILRQELAKEKDELKNPQSVDEAISLYQQTVLQSAKRTNTTMQMSGEISKFHHTLAIESVAGDYQGGSANE